MLSHEDIELSNIDDAIMKCLLNIKLTMVCIEILSKFIHFASIYLHINITNPTHQSLGIQYMVYSF